MAPQDRTATQSVVLEQKLQAEPYTFSFFQAIRRLETIHRDRPGVGKSVRPADDPFRLSQEPFLDFAPATLSAFNRGKDGRPSRLVSCFFGLFGPSGPLPLHLTELARERLRNYDDPTFARFLDVFHHRLLSLFYRAWASAQPTVQLDRPDSDRFADFVGSLIGIGASALRNRDDFPDNARRYHAGTLSRQTRNADGLAAMLAEFFRVRVDIQELVGHWMELPDECCTQLGRKPDGRRQADGSIIGRRVWDCQSKFRIVIGPVDYHAYQRFLPGGTSLPKLISAVRTYIGDELDWDLQLVLKRSERPSLELGRSGQLNRTAWIAGHSSPGDADDLVLNPQQADLQSKHKQDKPNFRS